jgi:CubicO group peptidase (beta-lactamase class C family)
MSLEAVLDSLAAELDFQGVVRVSRCGTPLLERAYGLADRENSVPMGATSRFRAGSITKGFVAQVLVELERRGALSLQDPIGGAVSGLPKVWKPLTTQQLLTHTSGLPHTLDHAEWDTLRRIPAPLDTALSAYFELPMKAIEAGGFAYSGVGFMLAARLAEESTGRTLAELLEEIVSAPLGLEDTGVPPTAIVVDGLARPYVRGTTGIEVAPPFAYERVAGSGNLLTTVPDLDRWLDRWVLADPTALETFGRTASFAHCKAAPCEIGRAWLLRNRAGHREAILTGRTPGTEVSLLVAPEERVTVVVASNVRPSGATRIAEALLDRALTDDGDWGDAAPLEVRPQFLVLPEWLRPRESMISGLAWYGEDLILLPQQRPVGGALSVHRGKLYSIPRSVLIREITNPSGGYLPVETWSLEAPGIDSLPGFQGFEAIAFDGDRVFATVEADPGEDSHAWLLRGRANPTTRRVSFGPPATRIIGRSGIRNLTEEALVVHGGEVVSIHEANGGEVNPKPVVHLFPTALATGNPGDGRILPMAGLEYRVTDATSADEQGRFWVTNYLWPGDSVLQVLSDPLGGPAAGSRSSEVGWVERLVELQITPEGISTTDRQPLYIEPGEGPRNWEGIVRLGELGFLVVIDKFPSTRLAFVPLMRRGKARSGDSRAPT